MKYLLPLLLLLPMNTKALEPDVSPELIELCESSQRKISSYFDKFGGLSLGIYKEFESTVKTFHDANLDKVSSELSKAPKQDLQSIKDYLALAKKFKDVEKSLSSEKQIPGTTPFSGDSYVGSELRVGRDARDQIFKLSQLELKNTFKLLNVRGKIKTGFTTDTEMKLVFSYDQMPFLEICSKLDEEEFQTHIYGCTYRIVALNEKGEVIVRKPLQGELSNDEHKTGHSEFAYMATVNGMDINSLLNKDKEAYVESETSRSMCNMVLDSSGSSSKKGNTGERKGDQSDKEGETGSIKQN